MKPLSSVWRRGRRQQPEPLVARPVPRVGCSDSLAKEIFGLRRDCNRIFEAAAAGGHVKAVLTGASLLSPAWQAASVSRPATCQWVARTSQLPMVPQRHSLDTFYSLYCPPARPQRSRFPGPVLGLYPAGLPCFRAPPTRGCPSLTLV